MSKYVMILLGVIVFFGTAIPSSFAYPNIEVSGYVSPVGTYTTNPDGTTTISEVLYSFHVETADNGAKMWGLSLEFEGDVFTGLGAVTFLNPADWMSVLCTSSSGNRYEFCSAGTSGTRVGAGGWLNFKVSDVTLYTPALTKASGDFDRDPSTIESWSEGQIWAQSFVAYDDGIIGSYPFPPFSPIYGSDGGSTAHAPEPASLLLLGSGLIGLGWGARKKFPR
ncbi:MAG: PEP-CTERM sorting domain-containing protein [Deltaproteobacteria bacterium]|nr:PEP-CTERM sorting domain-containing protein [Deltaproteobacteria bacterium]